MSTLDDDNTDAERLACENGGTWGSHPDYPVGDWRNEAANDETRLGYWAWVVHQIEMTEND